jgi:hypothetical protein
MERKSNFASRGGPTIRLDVSARRDLTEEEKRWASVIAANTERSREARRADYDKTPGLLGGEIDFVDRLHWDDLLQSPDVIEQCAEQTEQPVANLLKFARELCVPSNANALFWMECYYQLLAQSKLERDQDRDRFPALIASAHKAGRRLNAKKGGQMRVKNGAAAKAYIVETWKREGAEYKSKSDFADIHVKIISDLFSVKVKARQIREEWLSPTRSASKPVG